MMQALHGHPKLVFSAIAGAALFVVVFAVTYVAREHPAYVWDYRGYWETYWNAGELLSQGKWRELARQVAVSTWSSDYNPIPILALTPAYLAFGKLREAYIAGLALLYLVPLAWISFRIVGATIAQARLDMAPVGVLAAFFPLSLLYPPYWGPLLRGYPDTLGCVWLALAVLLLVRRDPCEKHPLRYFVYLGVTFWLMFLSRKWYAYAVASTVAGAMAMAAFRIANTPGSERQALVRTFLLNMLVVGATASALVVATQGGLAYRALTTDYSELYSGYQAEGMIQHVRSFMRHFGLPVLLAASAGAVYASRTASLRPVAVFLLTSMCTYFLLFTRVQRIDMHHYYPLAMWVFVFVCFGLLSIWQMLSGKGRLYYWVTVSAVFTGLFLAAFLILPIAPVNRFVPITAGVYPPIRLDNYGEYQRLVHTLNDLVSGGKRFAVFSSNQIMSDSLMRSIGNDLLDTRIVPVSQVDLKNRFDPRPLMADFLLVADPVQTHLRAGSQRVIEIPANAILGKKHIGQAYEQLPASYALSGGVKLSIYRKTRPFNFAEVDALYGELLAAYPAWASSYPPLLRLLLTLDNSDALYSGKVGWAGRDIFYLLSGNGVSTEISLNFDRGAEPMQGVSGLELSIVSNKAHECGPSSGMRAEIRGRDAGLYSGEIGAGEIVRVDLSPMRNERIFFSAMSSQPGGCQWMQIKLVSRN